MATDRQERAVQIYVENGGKSASAAMREAGYSEASAKNPQKLTESSAWKELLDKAMPDKKLVSVHKKLLNAHRIDHMVFPLGMQKADIKKLLNSVGCTPKKIQHGQQAIHVWFWAPDFKARTSAVELAYKIKGKISTKLEIDPDAPGLFNPAAELTIRVVDGRDNSHSEAEPSDPAA
jgi:phage terminase small subunit